MDERPREDSTRCIQLRGGRMHNLKNIDLDIPLGKLIVVCGVSGSGKTSLALDTLFAEGQRRYIESFAPQVRQFLPRPDKPDYDRLDNLPASIAIKRRHSTNDRATVATTSEIDDYLRILFAGVAKLYCPGCGRPIVRHDPSKVADWLATQPKTRAMITFEFAWANTTEISLQLADFQQSGFTRIIIGDKTWNVDSDDRKQLAQSASNHQRGFVVVDRIATGENTPRIHESLETAFAWGNDQVTVLVEHVANSMTQDSSITQTANERSLVDDRTFAKCSFSRELHCRDCDTTYALPEPNTFHFNSPLGACSKCDGLGVFGKKNDTDRKQCRDCNGSRVNQLVNAFRIYEQSITDIRAMTVAGLSNWLADLSLEAQSYQTYFDCIRELKARLQYLTQVGLPYLQLNRSLPTLSTGEAARVNLTNLLASDLVHMLYVLDEPTAGLHPSETSLLADVIESLCRRNNSLVLVEHEPLLIRRADWIIEIGPEAGTAGGQVCSQGSKSDWLNSKSRTAEYLKRSKNDHVGELSQIPKPLVDEQSLALPAKHLILSGAKGRNLKSIDLKIPLNRFCVVTGVSGSGKSTLVLDTLVPALQRTLGLQAQPLPYQGLFGHEHLLGVECIDASPVGQSKRSSPASFTKLFDDIRKLFASTPDATRLNWTASHFSFNSVSGQCPRCNGDGQLVIDMHFMTDIETECPECKGSGYRNEILSVKYRDRSIAECMAMSIADGKQFFRGQPKLQKKLGRMIDLGLGYLALGQRLSTPSSGELQRLKLANCLMASKQSMLFVMDEPTTGLHFADIERLLSLIRQLISEGHSVLVVEHNTQLIEAADLVIDLGPGAGDTGGCVIASGTPIEVSQNPVSTTGRYLFANEKN
jgi:excinuclease ABC subunit A